MNPFVLLEGSVVVGDIVLSQTRFVHCCSVFFVVCLEFQRYTTL